MAPRPTRVSAFVPILAVALVGPAGAPPVLLAQHPETTAVERPVPTEGVDFVVYGPAGEPRSFAELVATAGEADAVLVGESHDDEVGHAVEAEFLVRVTQRHGALGGGGRSVVLSLEMFERDVQYVLDEYLAGLVTEDQFLRSARPWDRYETDYRPMVEFARAHGLPVVAANAPRRYVNRVTRLGPASLAELPDPAPAFLPPLPYPGPSDEYAGQWNALMAGVEHDMGYALDAQALWDAAMGHAVARALTSRPRALVIHYAGSFHVAHGTGIPERLPDYRPGAEVLTVVLEPAEDPGSWDPEKHAGLGDFVVLTRAPAVSSP